MCVRFTSIVFFLLIDQIDKPEVYGFSPLTLFKTLTNVYLNLACLNRDHAQVQLLLDSLLSLLFIVLNILHDCCFLVSLFVFFVYSPILRN